MWVQFSVRPVTVSTAEDELRIGKGNADHFDAGSRAAISASGEGPWDEVMSAIARCHRSLAEVHQRVVTTIVIVEDQDAPEAWRGRETRYRAASSGELLVV